MMISVLVLAGCAGMPGMTNDVDAFMQRREMCDHFRGEDAYNQARAKEIDAGVKEYCTGTDKELEGLKAKYAKDPKVMDELGGYEDPIE